MDCPRQTGAAPFRACAGLIKLSMSEEVLIVLSTFGSVEEARQTGRTLVEERLAACVNLLPAVESIYRWKDAVQTSAETLALIKTTIARYARLEARLLELHSYEVPEIVALPLSDGSLPYLRWVEECCHAPQIGE
jgi:periplasmic divalent cation tolerance protein